MNARSGVDYIALLEAYNREKEFISHLPDQDGMPIWEKMKIVQGENKTSLMIPLSEDHFAMSSVLFALIDNDRGSVENVNNITNQELQDVVYSNAYSKEEKENLFTTFMVMDNYTFGTELFTNIPKDLFTGYRMGEKDNQLNFHAPRVKETEVVMQPGTSGKLQVVQEYVCAILNHCTKHGPGPCDGCSLCQTRSCSQSTVFIYSYPDPETGIVIFGYPAEGGGPGLPSVIPDPDPCGLHKAFYRVAPGCNGNNEPVTALDPCEILKRNSAKPKFKAKLDSLKYLVSPANPAQNSHETQVTVQVTSSTTLQYNVSGTPITTAAGTTSVVGQGTNYDIATMHNHPANHIPIFSAQDIVSFYAKYKFVEPVYQPRYIYYVANPNGTIYAIKIDDITALDALLGGYNLDDPTEREKANKKIVDIFRDPGGMNETQNYTAEMAEKMFLKTINSNDFGGGNSISLYQKQGNLWKRLTLNLDETVNKEPCPL